MRAVVPSPDETRGNVVKAFVVLTPGTPRRPGHDRQPCSSTCAKFLAPYEYPKEIEIHRQAADDDDGKGGSGGCCARWRNRE
jgi:acetyl-CoA synthetase